MAVGSGEAWVEPIGIAQNKTPAPFSGAGADAASEGLRKKCVIDQCTATGA